MFNLLAKKKAKESAFLYSFSLKYSVAHLVRVSVVTTIPDISMLLVSYQVAQVLV
jgi:hypothetical protein